MNAEFQHRIHEQLYKVKEDLLRGIMKQVLNREPTMEDAGKFQFLSHKEYKDREFIGHKEKGLLGEIVFSSSYSPETGAKLTFTFIPKTRFDL